MKDPEHWKSELRGLLEKEDESLPEKTMTNLIHQFSRNWLVEPALQPGNQRYSWKKQKTLKASADSEVKISVRF